MGNWARLRFDKYVCETNKAYLIKIFNSEIWLPKKLCRNLITNKKLGGNVELPEWLYIEKIGNAPPDDDYTYFVEKHIPNKLDPVENNIIKELKK